MSRKFFMLLLLGMLTVGAAGMSLRAEGTPCDGCGAPPPCDGCDGCDGGCPQPCDEECDDDSDDDCDD